MGKFIVILLAGLSLLFSPIRETASDEDIMVDCDFPGGNIVVDAIEDDTVFLHQDLRDTKGNWFYWYFRVRGAAGRKLNFRFTKGKVIGVRGPAVSTDEGRTWRWLGTEALGDMPMNIWIHVAMTWDSRTTKAYLNGKVVGEEEVDMAPSTGSMFIGKRGHGVTGFFNGVIDEVTVYNKALSSDEIQCIMDGSTLKDNLVLYFSFDEDEGDDTVKDKSGNGNTGFIQGRAKWVEGKFGKALEFNGIDSFVEVQDNNSLNPTGGLTVTAWVKIYKKINYGGIIDKWEQEAGTFKGYLLQSSSSYSLGALIGSEDTYRSIQIGGPAFHYTFPADAEEVRFSMGMPYVERNLHRFISRYEDNPNLKVGVLCKTRKGRDVELLRLGRIDGKCDHRVFLTCRHHACEMMASYSLEGIMESVLTDTDDGKWFREHVEFLVIPFVDKDGVEDGDQGKNRKPHDHNQDYAGDSIYPSVRAIKKLVPQWSEGLLRFSLDMHCPGLRGKYHEVLLFPTRLRGNENWKRVKHFLECLEAVQTGPLGFSLKDSLSFTSWSGSTRVVIPNTSSRWVRELPGVLFGTSLEIPYANASGKAVTAETAKAFGRDLARAMRCFLENL